MSRQINSNNFNKMNASNNFNKRSPKCLTCEKAGLTGKALEHYTRQTPDPNSPIVCPTILAFKCGHCGQAGHSKGFCKTLKADQARYERERVRRVNEEERRRTERRAEEERQRQETTRRLKNNIFTAFNNDEDEEDKEDKEEKEEKIEIKEEFNVQPIIKVQEMDFPSLSSKSSNQQARQTIQFSFVAKNAAHLPVPKPKDIPVPKVIPVVENTFDSDEEYDEEYNEEYIEDNNFESDTTYGRPNYVRQYYIEEHELEQQIKNEYPVRSLYVPDDDNW